MQKLRQVTENKLLRALEGIFRHRNPADTAIGYLERMVAEDAVKLPFPVGDLRVVYDIFPVFGNLIECRPRSPLLSFVTETPDSPILVMDENMSATQGLFFAQWLPDSSTVEKWLRCMTAKSVFVNSRKEDSVILAPVSAFVLC